MTDFRVAFAWICAQAFLRTLAADFDGCWNTLHPVVDRCSASSYDKAKRAIVDLSDAYALLNKKKEFGPCITPFCRSPCQARTTYSPTGRGRIMDKGVIVQTVYG